MMKMKEEAEEKLEKERKSSKEDTKVQIVGFKDRWRKVLRTVQDREVEIRRLKAMVADKWEKKIAAYMGLMKEMWFEATEAERVIMIKNVMRLMDFEVKCVAKIDAGLTLEDMGTGD